MPTIILARTRTGLIVLALLALAAACAPAAPSPTAAPARPTEAPKAAPKPTEAPKPAAQPTAKPAEAKPAPKPTEAPAAKPAGPALGTKESPLKIAFTPSVDSQKILATAAPLTELLTRETGLYFEVSVPTSYVAVIEAMGANKIDAAFLATFAYVLAHDRYGVEPILASVRQGSKSYRSQIIAHADSGITSLEQLRGKKFAFVDGASASGFLFPAALLAKRGIDYKTYFSETINAGGHDKVVLAVYRKQVDGGATFGNSVEGGAPTDARTLVAKDFPDVLEKVRPIAVTDPIPNDTVSVRKGLDPEIVKKLQTGLIAVSKTEQGAKVLRDLYNWNGVAETSDKEYDVVREAARLLKLDLEEQIKPKS